MEMQNSTRTQNKVLTRESKPLNRPQITPGELQTQQVVSLDPGETHTLEPQGW